MTSTPSEPRPGYPTDQPGAYGTPGQYPAPDAYPVSDAPAYDPYQPVGGAPPNAGYPGAAPTIVPTADPNGGNRSLGWAGVAVLYVLLVVQLLWPTVTTFVNSVRRVDLLGGSGDGDFIGLRAWADVLPMVASTIGFVLIAVVPVTLASLALGMVIGTALPPSSRTGTLVRVLVAVTGALFVPLGVGLSRWASAGSFGDAGGTVTFIVVTITLAWLPLLTAIFATAFGAALAPTRSGRGAGLVILVALAALIPAALQVNDLPMMLTGGGPGGATETPSLLIYRFSFVMFDFTSGSVVASLVLLVAGAFGIGAVVALLGARARFVVTPDGGAAPARSGVLGAVVAVAVLVVALLLVSPVLGHWISGAGQDLVPSPLRTSLLTWGPTALGAALQVVVAVVGGAAIGWCRPAGKRSVWLLLPFAPWLFVGNAPLMIARYQGARDLGILDSWLALVPPPVVVAALVVFTLLFAGLREQGVRPPTRALLAASAGTFGLLLLVQAQSLLPAQLVMTSGDNHTALQVVQRVLAQLGATWDSVPYGLLYPPPVLLLVVGLGVVGQLGVRRIALVRG